MCFAKHAVLSLQVPLSLYLCGPIFVYTYGGLIHTRFIRTYMYNLARAEHAGRYGQRAGSTHPTGMQSYYH